MTGRPAICGAPGFEGVAEDMEERLQGTDVDLSRLWERPVRKPHAAGIHGTPFDGFVAKRRHFPATKRERDWNRLSLNSAQRRLYGQA